MNASEVGNLVLTIVLGVVSIGLGIFAVWLSVRFNEQSTSALNAIKDLANEVRALSQANISQQKDFSSKMLDSILQRDQFGRVEMDENQESTALEDVIKRQLEETEVRITAAVEQRIRSLISSSSDPIIVQRAIDSIRSDIKLLTDKASLVSSNVEPSIQLRQHIDRWRMFPGFLVLLAAIVKENVHSIEELKSCEEKYNLPESWEHGVDILMSDEILIGSPEDFKIKPEYQTAIAALIDKNWATIRKLIKYYSDPENRSGSLKEEVEAITSGLEV